MSFPERDYTNHEQHSIRVLRRIGPKKAKNRSYIEWEVLCLICGHPFIAESGQITRGMRSCKSCIATLRNRNRYERQKKEKSQLILSLVNDCEYRADLVARWLKVPLSIVQAVLDSTENVNDSHAT